MLYSNEVAYAEFEVLTAVTTKSTIFWFVTPCSLVEVYRRSSEMSTDFYGTTQNKTFFKVIS
jgi:hypothetical protein